MKRNTTDDALAAFQSEKIMTVHELAGLLDSSEATARRRLKAWQAYRSYNKNGRYYVLPQIAKFDSSGRWKYEEVLFSKYGNLKETLFHFVDSSEAGLSASDISHFLRLPAYNFLSTCNKDWGLPKEKYQGIYMYFSKEPNILENQRKERENLRRSQARKKLPSETDSVRILVEFITRSEDTPEQLVRRVRQKGLAVGIEDVRNVLIYHGLLKKISDVKPFKP